MAASAGNLQASDFGSTLPSKRLINPCAQESLRVFSPQVECLPPPRPSPSTLLGWNSYSPLISDCSFMSAPSVLRGQINTNWLGVLFQRRLLGTGGGGFTCRKDSSVFQGDEWVV